MDNNTILLIALSVVSMAFCYLLGVLSIIIYIKYKYVNFFKVAKVIEQDLEPQRKAEKQMQDAKKHPDYKAVHKRINELAQITKEQLEIAASAQAPSQNALHSKHKSKMAAHFENLQNQKIQIITNILKDGYDPPIVVYNDDRALETIKLSEYLKRIKTQQSPPVPPPKSDPKNQKKKGRFTIYEGGKK